MRKAPLALWLLAALVVAVGCSDSTEGSATTTAVGPVVSTTTTTGPSEVPGFPVSVRSDTGDDVLLEQAPQRIVALSSVHAEMLFAIGAGPQVVAADLFTNFPPATDGLTKLDSFNLSVESVIDLAPDLVILSFDPVEAVAALQAVGIPTLLLGTAPDLEIAYAQLRALGEATGHSDEAEAVVADMVTGIAAVVESVGDAGEGVTFYHETDPFDFFTPSSGSFIGRLYQLLGMSNIADAAPDEFGSGFPQLSPEFIIDADPDVIFLASFGENQITLEARAGWDTMTAVQGGSVYLLDPDVASRWGPRVVDLMEAIGAAVLDYRADR